MSDQEIPKTYNAQDWEDKLYSDWEKSGLFNPDVCIEKGITTPDAPHFSIVLPPPNVTGTLHTGSACMLAIEDLIVRYHRMRGERTLWIPGTDHAAVATQSKVEKILWKEEQKTRHDLGREEMLRRIEAFAKQSHDTIVHQTKKIGSSLDWSREAYTLDDKRNFAVRTAFKRMYDDGLIYRGYRVVNWTVKGQSTCSDDEVVTIERQAKLYTFKYSKDFPITIATTRPETKLGDTAVAVHPDDARYQEYIGQTLAAEVGAAKPLAIKIIADETVDPAFGTGAVGVTPAHSHADFEMRERHPEIDLIQVIGPDGKMTTEAGSGYAGLPVLEAREKFVAWLRENDLLEKEEDIVQNVGTSDRYEDVLEVIPMRQWFVGVNKEFERDGRTVTLKTLMREAVTSKDITILPERFDKIYFHWIDNLRDWCISRQIWFGHRIPVFYCKQAINSQQSTVNEACKAPIVSIEPIEKCPHCNGEVEQDPDTLDTWFSSGLWTFSTLGWPNMKAEDLKNYHPTTLIETGYDILFFWIARMILMTEYLIGTRPFDTIYLHGLVRVEQGRKMSKSLDNIIDPLDVISAYGADALRMALVTGTTPGNDLRLGDEKIVTMRNFTNKLWNLSRYIGQSTVNNQQSTEPEAKTDADRWILEKLETVTKSVTGHLDRYELSLAAEELREFTWDHFADWYVEVHKVEKNDALLRYAFDIILKLWHPFMPFVTEAIHQTFHFDESEFLMVARWPSFTETHQEIADENRFELVKGLISEIRNIRATYRIEPATKMVVSVSGGSEMTIRDNEEIFKRLARVSEVKTLDSNAAPENSVLVQSGLLQAYLHLDGVVDITKERERFEKEKAEKTKYIATLEAKLGNANFVDRAKPEIVTAEREKLAAAQKELADIEAHLTSLS
jgi:valyl-tRNA synthetase